jgi:hypothetical protein
VESVFDGEAGGRFDMIERSIDKEFSTCLVPYTNTACPESEINIKETYRS